MPTSATATRAPLPGGTVTFAFTDIEGSTVRWDSNRAAMEDTVRRHDTLMNAAISGGGGRVFKTIGDAFCAAFARPEDAIAAMLDVQRAIAAEDFSAVDGLRVRMALHTGTTDERDGDYFGPTVNRVARLLATGHGGQVLLSAATAELSQGLLPPRTSLRDLGEHRLKDLTRPEHVYQLLAPDLPAEFPPLKSLGTRPNNLPSALPSFVGRETEIADITTLLANHRLVTLVGSGGVGKTRTSLQVAASLLDGFGDGVWVVELAPISNGAYLPSAVSRAVGLTLPGAGDQVENLVHALKSKRALLVFDNCEHLVGATRDISAAILRGCPQVGILASSREGLGIAGEATYRMPSLEAPKQAQRLTLAGAAKFPAITLFAERANAIDRRFALTDDNLQAVADICRRLDGIPLAIELAAARTKVLSPQQIHARLDERFRILTGGSRDVLPRQQTLSALFDWSYDLLDERERALFRRLGSFANTFTLDGILAVGNLDDLEEVEMLDLCGSLVDKSLVLAETSGDAPRYRLLESARVYAREKREVAGETSDCLSRHLRYLHDRFLEAEERYQQTGDLSTFSIFFAVELDDVRAALDHAVESSHAPLGADLLAATRGPWQDLGLDAEALARSNAYLAVLPESAARLNARLWNAVSRIAHNAGHSARAFEAATQAVGYARTTGDPVLLAYALMMYADGAAMLGRFADAEAVHEEASALANLSKTQRLSLLAQRATLSSLSGDLVTAKRAFEELLREHRAAGNAPGERSTALNLAEVEHARGYTNAAVALLQDVIPSARAHTDRSGLTLLLANLAGYLFVAGDIAAGCAAAREAIRNHTGGVSESWRLTVALEHLSLGLALDGDFAESARLAGYAEEAFRKDGFQRQYTEQTTNARLTTLLRENLTPGEMTRLLAEGAALTPQAAVAIAIGNVVPG